MGANKKVVNVAEAINAFDYWGTLVDFRPYGNGHINDTFLVRFRHEGKIRKYILQRINKDVFKTVRKYLVCVAIICNVFNSRRKLLL